MRLIKIFSLLFTMTLFLGACDSSGSSSDEDDNDGKDGGNGNDKDSGSDLNPDTGNDLVGLKGACPINDRSGGFVVSHDFVNNNIFPIVSGSVRDSVLPAEKREEVLSSGSCTIWKKHNPICDPSCNSEQACDHSNNCIAYPLNQDLGQVTMTGTDEDLTLINQNNLYSATDLQYPIFNKGREITLDVAGGDLQPFTLKGFGVAALKSDLDGVVVDFGKDEDLTITWDLSPADHNEIYFTLDVDQHGNSPVKLICTSNDSGSLTIPKAIIETFLDFGISGFSTTNLYRRTADSIDLDGGCVEFLVYSRLPLKLQPDGHTPCGGDPDCEPPQTCNVSTNTCE